MANIWQVRDRLPPHIGPCPVEQSLSIVPAVGGFPVTIDGGATEDTLSEINNKVPVLGQHDSAGSVSVVLASDATFPVTVAGVATEATLDDLNTKINNGSQNAAGSISVIPSSDGFPVSGTVGISGTVPVTVSGVATEATLDALNDKFTTGPQLASDTLAVSLATDQLSTLATQTTLAGMSAKLPATLGSATGANSLSVVSASDGLVVSGQDVMLTNRKLRTDASGYMGIAGNFVGVPTAVRTDMSGSVIVGGINNSGTATNLRLGSAQELLTGGFDGTNVRALRTDTAGNQVMAGVSAGGVVPIRVENTGGVMTAGNNAGTPVLLRASSDGSLMVAGSNHLGTATALRLGSSNQLLVGGFDGTNVTSLRTDTNGLLTVAGVPVTIGVKTASGSLGVAIASDQISTMATAALQGTGNSSLGTIATNTGNTVSRLPPSIGPQTNANSLSITPSTTAVFPVSSSTFSTSALQTTLNSAVDTMSAKLPDSLGAKSGATSFSVVPASDGFPVIVSGVATEATLDNLNTKINNGSQVASESISVIPSSDGFPVTGTVTVSGVATEATLDELNTKINNGSQVASESISVISTSDGFVISGQDAMLNNRKLRTDIYGSVIVGGINNSGTATELRLGSSNQLLVGGFDGTNIQALRTDTAGNQVMAGQDNGGSIVPIRVESTGGIMTAGNNGGTPVLFRAGSDGTFVVGGVLPTLEVSSLRLGSASQLLVGGYDGSNITSLRTDNTGRLIIAGVPETLGEQTASNSLGVAIASDQLSSLATSTLQQTGNNSLSTIETNTENIFTRLPPAIGPQTNSESLSITPSTTAVFPVSSSTFATSALQETLISSVDAMSAKLPVSLGAKTGTNSFSVVPASDGFPITGTVTVTGVATEVTLDELNTKINNGAQIAAGSISVIPSSDGFPVTGTVGISGTVPVTGTVTVTGVATEVTLDELNTKINNGAQIAAGSISVIPSSDGFPVTGTVGISGTVPVTGTVGISGTVPVTGTVGISGTVPVTGTVTVTGVATEVTLDELNTKINNGAQIAAGSISVIPSSDGFVISGKDGSSDVPIKTDPFGRVVVAGSQTDGTPTAIKTDANGAVLIAGYDGTNIRRLKTDTDGEMFVLTTQLPTTLGQTTGSGSVSVVVASDQIATFATEATLDLLNDKFTVGPQLASVGTSVTLATDQLSTLATEATLDLLNDKFTTGPQLASVGTAVTLATDQLSTLATEATLDLLNDKFTTGPQLASVGTAVTLATDQLSTLATEATLDSLNDKFTTGPQLASVGTSVTLATDQLSTLATEATLNLLNGKVKNSSQNAVGSISVISSTDGFIVSGRNPSGPQEMRTDPIGRVVVSTEGQQLIQDSLSVVPTSEGFVVSGTDGTTTRQILTDTLGKIVVSDGATVSLSSGQLSTLATQTTLAAISDKLPSSLGAKTGATSLSVVPASDGFPVTVTGVATAANQIIGNSDLGAIKSTSQATSTNTSDILGQTFNISSKLPASLGAKTGATSLSVVPASDGFIISHRTDGGLINEIKGSNGFIGVSGTPDSGVTTIPVRTTGNGEIIVGGVTSTNNPLPIRTDVVGAVHVLPGFGGGQQRALLTDGSGALVPATGQLLASQTLQTTINTSIAASNTSLGTINTNTANTAARLPASLAAKTGALSLSVVQCTDTGFVSCPELTYGANLLPAVYKSIFDQTVPAGPAGKVIAGTNNHTLASFPKYLSGGLPALTNPRLVMTGGTINPTTITLTVRGRNATTYTSVARAFDANGYWADSTIFTTGTHTATTATRVGTIGTGTTAMYTVEQILGITNIDADIQVQICTSFVTTTATFTTIFTINKNSITTPAHMLSVGSTLNDRIAITNFRFQANQDCTVSLKQANAYITIANVTSEKLLRKIFCKAYERYMVDDIVYISGLATELPRGGLGSAGLIYMEVEYPMLATNLSFTGSINWQSAI